MTDFFSGFAHRRVATSGADINLVTGGSGPPLGTGFDAMQRVTLANDADHPIVGMDDRHSADPALGRERCDRVHGCVRVEC